MRGPTPPSAPRRSPGGGRGGGAFEPAPGGRAAPAVRLGLRPGGTATALFLERARGAAQQPGASGGSDLGGEVDATAAWFPSALWERLRARDVAEPTLWVAHELVRLAPAASAAEKQALALLALALLEAMAAGSTYLPLGEATLAAMLERWLGDETEDMPELAEGGALFALVADLRRRRPPPALAHLFGAPGARTVFVVPHLQGTPAAPVPHALYAERVWAQEGRVLVQLQARSRAAEAGTTPATPAVAAVLRALRNEPGGVSLSSEQWHAVELALAGRLTVVAGGPGTGKTSSVVALLRALVRLGVGPEDIALAAPTGRAAQRITESIRAALARLRPTEVPALDASSSVDAVAAAADRALATRLTEATTLHRLIGIGPDRLNGLDLELPIHHVGWKLPHRVVIVDEASMIDLPLMDTLLAALAPETSLVLLGDADQLPSVELGAVFRDLAAGPATVVARLEENHRMRAGDDGGGAAILAAATAINRGDAAAIAAPTTFRERADASALAFRGAELIGEAARRSWLERWWNEVLAGDGNVGRAVATRFPIVDGRLQGPRGAAPEAAAQQIHHLIDTHARARVLCLTRRAPYLGSVAFVNDELHQRARRAAAARGADPRSMGKLLSVVPGEPVIFLANDYGRGLFNGDLGIVVRGGGGDPRAQGGGSTDRLQVAFARPQQAPFGLVFHALDELEARLELAYALTVHKAQGSELDQVSLLLPPHDIPLLSRDILYTALTRARTSVVVVGSRALLAVGAARTNPRASGLAS